MFVRTIGGGSVTSSAFGDGSGILTLSGASLMYIGSGETATRQINLNATTTIDQSVSGALVLTELLNNSPGAKTLTLRGNSMDANTISSNLADNGGVLTVTKSDGGTWILSGAYTFTGILQIQVWIGVPTTTTGSGATSPLGFGQLQLTNGGIFAMNPAGLTINNAVQINNNASDLFGGVNSINVAGVITLAAGNTYNIINTIASPGTLSISGSINSGNDSNAARLYLPGNGNYYLEYPAVQHDGHGSGSDGPQYHGVGPI